MLGGTLISYRLHRFCACLAELQQAASRMDEAQPERSFTT
jgi:hypothetical protein